MISLELNNFINADIFEENFISILKKYKYPPIFLCIGTSKCLQDCFGVFCGTALKKQSKFKVFGSIKHEINARNFLQTYEFIKRKNKNSPIVIIDNVFIKNSNETMLILKNTGICPNAIFNKRIIGDVSILINGFSYNMFKTICIYKKIYKSILNSIKKLNNCFE